MCHFLVEKYVIGQIGLGSYGCHWAGQRRELIYYDCFLSNHQYNQVFVSGKNLDLCSVWIYLVWWAIITCGRKYQLSEADAHMDQLLLALLIADTSLSDFTKILIKEKAVVPKYFELKLKFWFFCINFSCRDNSNFKLKYTPYTIRATIYFWRRMCIRYLYGAFRRTNFLYSLRQLK